MVPITSKQLFWEAKEMVGPVLEVVEMAKTFSLKLLNEDIYWAHIMCSD